MSRRHVGHRASARTVPRLVRPRRAAKAAAADPAATTANPPDRAPSVRTASAGTDSVPVWSS
jgi:hypothetical protein